MAEKTYSDKPDNEIPTDNTEQIKASETIDSEQQSEDGEVVSPEEQQVPETLQKEIIALQDRYLRLSAEFDNYRKRTLREKTELIQTAGESLLKNILPVVDDFERGLDIVHKATDIEAVEEGMKLIYDKLIDFLSASGVKEIKAMNESFDAEWHEAVTNIPAPSEKMKGKVVDVIQKGYVLHDKVMRYPKVVVGE